MRMSAERVDQLYPAAAEHLTRKRDARSRRCDPDRPRRADDAAATGGRSMSEASTPPSMLPSQPSEPVYVRARGWTFGGILLTGYIDDYLLDVEADRHAVRVTGRSRTEDTVDCRPDTAGGQFAGYSSCCAGCDRSSPRMTNKAGWC